MSSYFDETHFEYDKLLSEAREDKAEELARKVWNRYKKYLKYIKSHAYKKDLLKLNPLLTQFGKILCGDFWKLHSFAHDVARAGIRLRGGMRALDNPYWPDHYDIP